ncbi:MAG TPA: sodium:proline symporter [Verrucomicrobiales bacterium]|nr:sodium:proline symporter [Pedosphaera sp.]MBL6842414.1 sodium:solute symporter family protein [Verrucomicrobiae bacterium]RZO73042.1 MAG: sodium:solute symporter family protein [Limisphaerales bacterium]HAO67238.1 sodium:proline symporter [Verrucomicrobiales bacterium]HAW00711.1 sodium:proline symporter [Verrucomicrobiales bacterium]|tara:strand:- start:1790 stop:3505 length:1716 start_codon:yes stop_codon:yes gene_type:complete
MTPLIIIVCYLGLLLALGIISSRSFRGTSKDYFVASHSIGPFLLLMSVFGTTMTAFALVGSTGKAFERGIGVYGLMASISGLVHAAVFFLIGIRLWVYGKKYGFVTQIQFFRARFDSQRIGYVLFPILAMLVVPYLLIGIIGAGKTVLPVTAGAFPDLFPNAATPQWAGGIPVWLTGLVICGVVMTYVFLGGSRGAAWANTFQTIVFMVMGLVAFVFIANSLGGLTNASKVAIQINDQGEVVQPYRWDTANNQLVVNDPPKVVGRIIEGESDTAGSYSPRPLLSRQVTTVELENVNKKTGEVKTFTREYGMSTWMFLTYLFIPLSVGMFPHLFQHWLTAKSARAFKLTVFAHPLCILIVWVPCVLIGIWATGILPPLDPTKVSGVLGQMVARLVSSPILSGFLIAGILAAIMSSLDSQFLCLGTMFTNDIVIHKLGSGKLSDRQVILIARGFVVGIVTLTYLLSLVAPQNVFDLAVWCFSGFGALFPLVFAAVFWKRVTKAGAYACISAATLSWFYFFAKSGFGSELILGPGIMPVAVCFLISTAALIIVSLMTRPPSEETIKKFFPDKAS